MKNKQGLLGLTPHCPASPEDGEVGLGSPVHPQSSAMCVGHGFVGELRLLGLRQAPSACLPWPGGHTHTLDEAGLGLPGRAECYSSHGLVISWLFRGTARMDTMAHAER